jgi:hypothetical protein
MNILQECGFVPTGPGINMWTFSISPMDSMQRNWRSFCANAARRSVDLEMTNRNLSRRLERLEEETKELGVHHVITMTYVNCDGTPAEGGYRIEGPLARGEFRRTPLPLQSTDSCYR